MLQSLLVTIAHAQDLKENMTPPASCNFGTGIMRWDCFGDYLGMVAQVVIGFAGTLALIFVMINGIKYMLNSATGEDSSSAKTGIFHSLIGVVVALLAYVILDTIVTNVT